MSEVRPSLRELGVGLSVLALLTLGLAWDVPTFGLSGWDTDRYYTENPLLTVPLSVCLSEAWTEPFVQSYHPLHVSLICFEGALSSDPAVWHRFTVVLFVFLGWALFFGFRALLRSWVAALLGSALVLAHPAMVESYASLPSQKDLMASIFSAGILALIPGPATVGRTVGMALLLVAAAFSKSGYALPLGLAPLAWDVLVRRPPPRAHLRSGVVAALAVLLTVFAFSVVVKTKLPKEEIAWMDPAVILSTGAYYAGVVFGGISPPPVPCLDTSALSVALGALAVVLHLVAVGLCLRFDRKVAAFGLVLGALGIAPYLNAIPTPTLLSGRWVLVLLLGTAIAAVDLARGPKARAVLASLVVVGIALSVRAQQPWSSRLALWRDNVEKNDCSSEPYSNLATAYSLEGRWDEAEEALVRGIAVEPKNGKLYRDWALLVMLTGGCTAPLPPLEAKQLYDDMATGAFTASEARARGLHDVARILVLRRARASRGSVELPATTALGGEVCDRDRERRLRALVDATEE